jgi:hypothetical protein
MFHLLSSYATYLRAPVDITGGVGPSPHRVHVIPSRADRLLTTHRFSATAADTGVRLPSTRSSSSCTSSGQTAPPGRLLRGRAIARPLPVGLARRGRGGRRLSTTSVLTARSTSLDVPTQTPTSAAPRASLPRMWSPHSEADRPPAGPDSCCTGDGPDWLPGRRWRGADGADGARWYRGLVPRRPGLSEGPQVGSGRGTGTG